MAGTERDHSTSSEERAPSRFTRTRTEPLGKATDVAAILARHRERRARHAAVRELERQEREEREARAEGGATTTTAITRRGSWMSESNGMTFGEASERTDENGILKPETTTFVPRRPRGGWMASGGANRMTLGEAFSRTDENGIIPIPEPERPKEEEVEVDAPTTFVQRRNRGGWMASSRMTLGEAWARTDENGIIPQNPGTNTTAPESTSQNRGTNSSDDTSPLRQGSPSPGPRERRVPSPTSPEESKVWDADLDFTAQSVQASTPVITVYKKEEYDRLFPSRSNSSTSYDSGDLLRRLSRVVSNSSINASVSKAASDTEDADPDPKSDILDSKSVNLSESRNVSNGSDSNVDLDPKPVDHLDAVNYPIRSNTPASKSDVDPEERITAEAMLFELPDDPVPALKTIAHIETPAPAPTPKVTGAYIETPAQALSDRYRNQRKKSKTSSISPPRGRFYDARRPLINTAKPVSAAEDVKRIELEARLEDSTLEDFDAILEAEAATETHTTIVEPVLDLEYDERGLPLSEKEIERRMEALQLDRMNQTLKKTSTNIREAKHGIERIEEQVSASIVKVAPPPPPPAPTADGALMYININIPVPRLYISQPQEKSGIKRGWKFTWFGFLLSLFFVWYLSESAMCSQFCHPVASSKNTWQPSDPFFPWAIPTKLDQWTGEVVSSGLGRVAKGLGVRSWDWSPFPTLPPDYKGGPIGSSDWWLGRNGPVGLMAEDKNQAEGIFGDEIMI